MSNLIKSCINRFQSSTVIFLQTLCLSLRFISSLKAQTLDNNTNHVPLLLSTSASLSFINFAFISISTPKYGNILDLCSHHIFIRLFTYYYTCNFKQEPDLCSNNKCQRKQLHAYFKCALIHMQRSGWRRLNALLENSGI